MRFYNLFLFCTARPFLRQSVHMAFLFFLLLPLSEVMAEETALQLMEELNSQSSWTDMTCTLTLSLTNKRGDSRIRELSMWSKTNDKDEAQMLMRFEKPADVRGTGFLQIEHKDGEDDRRLYSPAMRRVQRISASGSGGNFMSSDFSYYDIGAPELNDWNFSFGETHTVDGIECQTVIAIAKEEQVTEDTGYSKIVWNIDRERMITLKANFYDDREILFKELEVSEVQKIKNSYFATHMVMTNKITGHKSEMIFDELKVDTGLKNSFFTERQLRKGKR